MIITPYTVKLSLKSCVEKIFHVTTKEKAVFRHFPITGNYLVLPSNVFSVQPLLNVKKYQTPNEPFMTKKEHAIVDIELPKNSELFLFKFTPSGFSNLFGVDAFHLLEERILCKDFHNSKSMDLLSSFNQESNITNKISIIQSRLEEIKNNHFSNDSSIEEAIKLIKKDFTHIKVNDIIRKLNISRSTLERKFKHRIGHSPKATISLVRISHMLSHIKNEKKFEYEKFGYYDQSHFLKEYKKFSNILPKELI
jgi:AraC-like DNA-binding protein